MKTPRRKKPARKPRPGPVTARRRGPSPAGLQQLLDQRTRERDEALEQQAATSEVLRVISSSPGDLAPVFQSMLRNATQLCEAQFGLLYHCESGRYRLVATHNTPQALADYQHKRGLFHPTLGTTLDQLLETKKVIHSADNSRDKVPSPSAKLGGARSHVTVPMLKDDELVGAIVIYRQEVRPFTDKQVELVTNFAAQAVIAIENARLLNELRQRTGDLSEALDQQTATSEVLKVISSSPGELEPVFNAMLANATRICEAEFGTLFRYDGKLAYRVAGVGTPATLVEFQEQRGPFTPDPRGNFGRCLRNKAVVHVADELAEPKPGVAAVHGGARSTVHVPMLKDNEPIGIIVIYRQEVRPFTDKQIELVQNFAAQAVIAIENTRLLNELRQRTDDLSEALEQQTATSDVLKVISSSPGELAPVFQAMLEKATGLCGAEFGALFLAEGEKFRAVAMQNLPRVQAEQLEREPLVDFAPSTGSARAMAARKVLQIQDLTKEKGYVERNPRFVNLIELGGARSALFAPLVKDSEPIGVMVIYRQEVGPFTDKQIELLQNFAAQAVIAIENTRLLNELRESLQRQTATADVLKVISRSTFDLQTVLNTLVESACRLCNAGNAFVYQRDGDTYRLGSSFGFAPDYQEYMKRIPVKPDRGTLVGRTALEGKVVHIPDVQNDPEYTWEESRQRGGYRTMLGIPLLREGVPIGVLAMTRPTVQPFTDKQTELLTTFADQAVIAIENVRLFDEIQDKSRQLAEASKHKSQFLANMSHELRTPLNAILGYTELVLDGIYGEAPQKALDVLKRVESNGRHLLGLINDVLDLSKIEAGELKLSLTDYSMKDVVYNVFSAVEPLATKKKLDFKVNIPPDLPPGQGDERRLTQVLLNLVGNAIKFTDAGAVAIKIATADGAFSVAVHDTGPGISAADQTKLFQEFQQADSSITKSKGGTGLGLAISRHIVELHGGRLWVESSPGDGSTFTFTIPVTVEQQARPS
jgi:signal transduction histidine kinase